MDVSIIQSYLRARNPFALPASSLPAPLLLMARLVTLILLVQGYAIAYMPRRGVPFLAVFESVGSEFDWKRGLSALFLAGAFLVFFNLRPRLGCLLVGASLVTGTLIDSAGYANSRLFPGCLLLLTALQDGSAPARLALRAQVFLLYLGATLSKLFEPDWWNGQYFEFWLREKLGITWYAHLADALPPLTLSTFMGVTTMVMEGVICVSLLRRSLWTLSFATALVFHVSAFLVCGLDFGVFLYVSILSFLVLAPDDLLPRLGALPLGSVGRSAVSQPWIWSVCMLALPLSASLSQVGQKFLVAACTATALGITFVYARSRPGRSHPESSEDRPGACSTDVTA
ncbi:MAG: HTTM domain-containing protein [Opitutaceae bacterium]